LPPLYSNTTGGFNVGIGGGALSANTTGAGNTALGYQAGYTNATSTYNVFIGYQAGYTSNASQTNWGNVCVGPQTGYSLTTGYGNSFIGGNFQFPAGGSVTTGNKNTILGGFGGNQGGLDIRTSSNNIVLSDGDGNPRFASDNTGKLNTSPGVCAFFGWNNERSRGSSTALDYKAGYNSSNYSGYFAEFESSVEMYQVVSSGTTLTIPITNQGGVWVSNQVRIRGVAVNFNQTDNLAFTADVSVNTATTASGFASSSTGNISSIAMSGTSIVITFTTAYAQTTASQQVGGVCVYIEHLGRKVQEVPIVWSSIAMN